MRSGVWAKAGIAASMRASAIVGFMGVRITGGGEEDGRLWGCPHRRIEIWSTRHDSVLPSQEQVRGRKLFMTSISVEEFHGDIRAAERAAHGGPVVVVEGGTPEYVVLTYKDFAEMNLRSRSLADVLSMPPDAGDVVDFDIPQMKTMGLKIPDFD